MSIRSVVAITMLFASPALAITDKERRDAFAWFDSLDYPDTKEKPFVRARIGGYIDPQTGDPASWWTEGFLIAHEGDHFTLLTIHLTTESYQTTKPAEPGVPDHERVGFERVDFRKWAAAMLAEQRKIPADDAGEVRHWKDSWSPLNPARKTRLFFIARALDRQGHADMARQMCDFAAGLTDLDEDADPDAARGLPGSIQYDLATVHFERASNLFAGDGPGRAEILGAFEKFTRDFSPSHHVNPERIADAKYTVALLKQMLAEDARHAKRARKTWEESTQAQRIAELIHRLRDPFEPAAGFAGMKGDQRPAQLLEEIGFDAIPALIEAAGDRRFSRGLGQDQTFDRYTGVPRIGDAAVNIIESIAARRFNLGNTADADIKGEIQAWWDAVRTRGQRTVLVEGIEVLDENSPRQAWRLLQLEDAVNRKRWLGDERGRRAWEERAGAMKDRTGWEMIGAGMLDRSQTLEHAPAVGALLRVIENADTRGRGGRGGEARFQLMGIVQLLDDGRVDEMFARMMRESGDMHLRWRAAMCLHQRGSKEAVPALLAELALLPRVQPKQDDGRYGLVEFLVECGDSAALEGLARLLPLFEPKVRVSAIMRIDELRLLGMWLLHARSPVDDALRRALSARPLETWLAGELRERGAVAGMSTSVRQDHLNVHVGHPRVCDMAANRLERLAPARYGGMFDMRGTIAQRNACCTAMWRQWKQTQP